MRKRAGHLYSNRKIGFAHENKVQCSIACLLMANQEPTFCLTMGGNISFWLYQTNGTLWLLEEALQNGKLNGKLLTLNRGDKGLNGAHGPNKTLFA